MSEFEVVATEQIFVGRVVRLQVDEVSMPGGGTAKRELVRHDLAVAVVALAEVDDGEPEVVLIEQYRHPLGRRLWELPAGLMDVAGEGPLETAQRELAEETGLAAVDWTLLVDVAASPGFTDEVAQVFCARGLWEVGRPAEAVDEEADLRIVRVPLSVAVHAVFDGRIINSASVAGILSVRLWLSGQLETRSVNAGFGPASLPGSPGDRHAPELD